MTAQGGPWPVGSKVAVQSGTKEPKTAWLLGYGWFKDGDTYQEGGGLVAVARRNPAHPVEWIPAVVRVKAILGLADEVKAADADASKTRAQVLTDQQAKLADHARRCQLLLAMAEDVTTDQIQDLLDRGYRVVDLRIDGVAAAALAYRHLRDEV